MAYLPNTPTEEGPRICNIFSRIRREIEIDRLRHNPQGPGRDSCSDEENGQQRRAVIERDQKSAPMSSVARVD